MIGAAKDAIIARRGKQAKNIAKVAAARGLLTLVFYGMRDGQIRCLARPAARRPRPHRPGPARPRGRQAPPAGREVAAPFCPAAPPWRRGAPVIGPA